ncbi:MAG: lysylphosphatidylglycerol synthase domain-containing protein [Anaerolineae bacterium]
MSRSWLQGDRRVWVARLKVGGRWLLAALVLFFLGRVLVNQWDEVRAVRWQVDMPILAAAYLLLGLAWLALVANWRWLMARMGAGLGLGASWRIWFLSNIVRYIPGNVWQYLGMVYLCRQEGIAAATTLASIVLDQVVSVASGLALAVVVYLASGGLSPTGGASAATTALLPSGLPLWGLAGLVVLAVVVCYPPLMNWLLRQAFRLLRREPVQVELAVGDVARFFLHRTGVWVLQGLAFAVLVRSVYPVGLADLPAVAASFVASWVVGFLSLLTPSGLGVREAVQAGLLSLVVPWPVAVALAILSRIWLIAGEVTGAGLGLALGRWGKRGSGQEMPQQEVPGQEMPRA